MVGPGHGFDQRDVLRSEAGVILKQWAGRTKVGTAAAAARIARLRAIKKLGLTQAPNRGDVSVNAGWKSTTPYGMVWVKRTAKGGTGKKYIMLRDGYFQPGMRTGPKWRGFGDAAVAKVRPAVMKATQAAVKSVGLARQSIVQIADSLGIDLVKVAGAGADAAGIAKARAAIASTGKSYRNGTGTSAGTEVKPYIDLFNSLPYATSRKLRMDRTLIGIIHGRTKHFQKAYERGAFESLKKLQRAYPNLIKVATAA